MTKSIPVLVLVKAGNMLRYNINDNEQYKSRDFVKIETQAGNSTSYWDIACKTLKLEYIFWMHALHCNNTAKQSLHEIGTQRTTLGLV